MATIYTFPTKPVSKPPSRIRIPLYTDTELEAVLICLNTFCMMGIRFNLKNISGLDPEIVLECLNMASSSHIFSDSFKETIKHIIGNVEYLS